MWQDDANEIIDGLYLGNMKASLDVNWLRDHNIKYIVNVGAPKPPKRVTEVVNGYLRIEIDDVPESDLLVHLDSTCRFIEESLSQGNVLIHCAAGISRSPSVVAAFLIKTLSLTPGEALAMICKIRIVRPNPGFFAQLKEYYKITQSP